MRRSESLAQQQAEMRAAQASPRGRGRPRLPLDRTVIFELGYMGLSNRQIAIRLGCDHKTIGRFSADLALARLRRQTLRQLEQMRLIEEENSWAALEAQLKTVRRADGKVKKVIGKYEEETQLGKKEKRKSCGCKGLPVIIAPATQVGGGKPEGLFLAQRGNL